MSRTRSRRSSLALAALPALGAALLAAPEARAQTPSGWALNRYEPTPTGDVFFMAEHPWYSSTRYFAAGIVGDYAFNPLVLRQTLPSGETRSTDVISGMFVGHVGIAASFLDRVGLHLSLPISLLQDGTATTAPTVTLGPSSSAAVGDLRIGARVRLVGHADRDPISLHLGVMLWAPIGSRADNMGDEAIRVEPRLTLAGRGGPVRWSFGGGFTVRGDIDAENLAIGNELRLTAAVGIAADQGRLTIGPEAYVVTSIRDLTQGRSGSSAFSEGQWGGEAILGAHYTIADQVMVGLGGGVGLERGYGIPAGRLLFSVAYAPIRREQAAPSDRDGDGVLDRDDLCPDTHMGPHPDPNRRGCPLLDTDSDGVFDPDDICPTVPQGEHPDPQRRGCPTPDSDGDGVLDPEDQCVTTPQGEHPDPERPGCPDGDRDHDGVLDHADQCPDVHQGPHPDPARPGCPLPDRDRDTVPDPEDHCPDVPGAPSRDPNRNGCPDGNVRIEGGRIATLAPVFFDTDRDTIRPVSLPMLRRLADAMQSATFIRRVRVEGHTDDRGSHDHNVDLSQRRAQSVMRFLVQNGVEEGRLEAQGFGPDRPIASNQTARGRAQNRRVEFVITDPAPGEAGTLPVQVQSATEADPNTRDSSSRRRR